MLVNNFKPLLWFGNAGTFKDVAGNDVNVNTYIGSQETSGVTIKNNHKTAGVVRSFNYDTTTASNSCVDEQTIYRWTGIVLDGYNDTSTIRSNGFTLFIGTGETPVTEEDYKLDTPTSLSVTIANCTHNTDGTTTVTRTFQNNTENEVTIKELGLYCFYSCRGDRATTPSRPIVMIGRKVLTTPVTIPVGASYTFTWTIDLVKNLQFTED